MGKKVVIVYHSYLSGPCLDGIVSTLLLALYGPNEVVCVVPHTRSFKMPGILKLALEGCIENIQVQYLDIAPVDLDEVDVVMAAVDDEDVIVWDHHPSDVNVDQLRKKGVQVDLDLDLCVSAQVFEKVLTVPRRYQTLINLIQFTEYEGTDDMHQRSSEVLASCHGLLHLLPKIDPCTVPYIIVDELLSTASHWNSLAPFKNLLDRSELSQFKSKARRYLDALADIADGRNCLAALESRAALHKQLKSLQSESKVIDLQVTNDKNDKVLLMDLDIRRFGRSLEPVLRSWMMEYDCSYAILINPMIDDVVYVSLRRRSAEYNAKDIAKVVAQISGTTKFGGHHWGAGATLTRFQYERLQETLKTIA